MSTGTDSELESFRRQWLSDLQSKKGQSSSAEAPRPPPPPPPPAALLNPPPSSSAHPPPAGRPNGPPSPTSTRRPLLPDDDEDYLGGRAFDEPQPQSQSGHTLSEAPRGVSPEKELVSGLDHFEEAMEKEASGSMGDSLKLYRKAYKLDNRVERTYREKHFPPPPNTTTNTTTNITTQPTSSTSQPAIPTSAPTTDTTETPALPTRDLISSFASLKISPLPPSVEGAPPPPCPIASLPDELIIHILRDVAISDVGDFARLALVCKQFAYHVATEEGIWRRVCVGSEVGFAGVRYHWWTNVDWSVLEIQPELVRVEGDGQLEFEDGGDGSSPSGTILSPADILHRREGESHIITQSLTPSLYRSWKHMLRARPRIRFNGCYISTVNYVRTGQASTNQATWGASPIHIVTYYRYLRFFRDGSALSLLSTDEPADVVHHLTRELLLYHRGNAHSHLPSSVMALALRGRWRLSSALDRPDAPLKDREGDLFVETEGVVGAKYVYRMDMSLRSAGKAARNNKIAWRGFYSYNKLTDDWAEFGLKGYKPFFFSRVKTYGAGE